MTQGKENKKSTPSSKNAADPKSAAVKDNAAVPKSAAAKDSATDKNDVSLSPALEDYIEAIFDLSKRGSGSVRNMDIAEELNVTKASVARALKHLRQEGYIEQEPYADAYLTEKGNAYGQRIIARHWALRTFLTDVLGVEPTLANKEACEMEHTISQSTIEKWIAWLKSQNINISEGDLH